MRRLRAHIISAGGLPTTAWATYSHAGQAFDPVDNTVEYGTKPSRSDERTACTALLK